MAQDSAPARPASLAAQRRLRSLQSDIMDLILDRNLDVGDPMPTEAELCTALGVGRNTVREALKVLQALGVVEIRHGFGTFVAAAGFESLASSLAFRGRLSLRHGGHEAMELADVRQALEAGLIGMAIDQMTPGHLAELEKLVEEMEQLAAAGTNFSVADQEFHRQLYTPLHNELLTNLLDVFWSAYAQIHRETGFEVASLQDNAYQHRLIFEAVRDKDKDLAARRVSAHFDGIRDHLNALTGPAPVAR